MYTFYSVHGLASQYGFPSVRSLSYEATILHVVSFRAAPILNKVPILCVISQLHVDLPRAATLQYIVFLSAVS